ncbi:MAG: hypothetical protein IPK25_09380 [Saprospiraceae bacterium]|nr:hypothetical protein [Saprospiraceae bacterium]
MGLSLSYDIIHAHGGKLVDSKEGMGTTFTLIRHTFPQGKLNDLSALFLL